MAMFNEKNLNETSFNKNYTIIGDMEDYDGNVSYGVVVGEYDDFEDAKEALEELKGPESMFFNLEIVSNNNDDEETDEDRYYDEYGHVSEDYFDGSSMPEDYEDYELEDSEEYLDTIEDVYAIDLDIEIPNEMFNTDAELKKYISDKYGNKLTVDRYGDEGWVAASEDLNLLKTFIAYDYYPYRNNGKTTLWNLYNNIRKMQESTNMLKESQIENSRNIETGLSGKKNEEILNSVIGQMSDGIWEESPRMDKYWKNAEIGSSAGNVIIIVNGNSWQYDNGFRGMTDEEVKRFFANKIKQIIKIELEDGVLKGSWARDNMEVSQYIGYDEDITVSDCYKAYEILLGRKVSGRYKESYAVIQVGGSIGEIDNAKNNGSLYDRGGVHGIIVKKFDDPEEAKQYARKMRKYLTPGEREYYRMGYKTVKLESIDVSVNESLKEGSVSVADIESALASLKEIEYDVNEIIEDDNGNIEVSCTSPDAKQRIKNRLKRAFPNNKVELRGLFSVTLFNESKKLESYDEDTYHEHYNYDQDEELLYLFPNEPAFVEAIDYLYQYDLMILGRNLFENEDNLVVRGKLKDLEKFADEVLAYELHPDYLYREEDFAGDIIDLTEIDDTDMYDESILKESSGNSDDPLTTEQWQEYLNKILGQWKDSSDYPYYVENYSTSSDWEVVVQDKHINEIEKALDEIKEFAKGLDFDFQWAKRDKKPYQGVTTYYMEINAPTEEDIDSWVADMFNESEEGRFAIMATEGKNKGLFLGNLDRSWVSEDSKVITKFSSREEAEEFLKLHTLAKDAAAVAEFNK